MRVMKMRLKGYAYLFLMAVYILAIWFIVLNVMGCSRTIPVGIQEPVLMAPATPQQCANGGTQVTLAGQSYLACNGAPGQSIVGPAGPQGEQGPQGSPGQDAIPVTVVQFCPGYTPVYPNAFPEVGVCISGQLYGVYSANDGFMALLTPGTYSSNGINASCTFTIGPNCQVTQ